MEIFALAITIFSCAITIFSIVIAIQTKQNGKWIRDTLSTIHQESETRHREVLELLKKGFSEILTEVKST